MTKNISKLSPKDYILIKGAKLHNLKNIDVAIPRNKLVVITGLSGSGKSSLAFDTLYAEGQRRYVESLSSYARQFLGKLHKPKVDYIKGIAPAIAIEQKVNSTNPRSTVGTSTEIFDYLKLLFARIGKTYSKILDKDLTEDIFQDTFIKVIKTLKQGKYNEEGKFLPWVMRIAHNLVIDHFRKSSRMPKFSRTDDFDIFDVLSDASMNRESEIIQKQLYKQITSIIRDLPEDQQEVLTMRIYKELSFKEISENTGVSINTVLGRMRYALINLRKIVAQKEIILTN